MAEKLLNKVAVITGAGSGIGRAIAECFLAEGAKVVLFSRNSLPLEEVAAEAPARALVVGGDVTRRDDLMRLRTEAVKRFGHVDILVPNAGLARSVAFAETSLETVEEQFAVNFQGALWTAHEFLPHMAANSSILFITACSTQLGLPGFGVYNASKAALQALARTLAVELAPRSIRVNCIAPGPTTTPLWEKVGLPKKALKEMTSQIKQRLIAGKFGRPEDIAETALFLASDNAQNIHGQEVVVDGGYTIG